MSLRAGDIVIDQSNFKSFVAPVIDGEQKATGLVPRDYDVQPKKSQAVNIVTIPRDQWKDRVRDKVAKKSQLSDIRLTGNNGGPIPSLDQNGAGYCWAHDPTHAAMILRALAGLPYVPLSAFAVACKIKNFRDEGGWAALALDFIVKNGAPSQHFWPQKSMSRSNDNAATWQNAALHKVDEAWIDLDAAVYDRKLSFDQEASLLLSNTPVCKDENWWGHSICGLDLVDTSVSDLRDENGKLLTGTPLDQIMHETGYGDSVFGVRIWNSWSDSWGDRGMGVLRGSQAVSDGAVAPRSIVASAA